MKNKRIGFIGTGNIASAIIFGILNLDYIIPENIYVFDLDETKKNSFLRLGLNTVSNSKELVESVDYVFLTIKPQVYQSVLAEIKDVSFGKCFIDVAAGITIGFVKSILGEDATVIRVMPNTPLTVGCGSTALVKAENVTDEQFEFISKIFASLGATVTVDEEYINTVTAISGSSPAFILQFAKSLIEFGVSSGMEESDVKKLVLNTFIGSAKLALNSENDISTLIENVTSPGGTTAAGRQVLKDGNFDVLIKNCLQKTVKRAEELTK